MSFKIELIPEAQNDYKKLDGSIKKLVNKKLDELSEKPLLGEQPSNKHNIDLTGFFKIYVAKKSYRIVYRLLTPLILKLLKYRVSEKEIKKKYIE